MANKPDIPLSFTIRISRNRLATIKKYFRQEHYLNIKGLASIILEATEFMEKVIAQTRPDCLVTTSEEAISILKDSIYRPDGKIKQAFAGAFQQDDKEEIEEEAKAFMNTIK